MGPTRNRAVSKMTGVLAALLACAACAVETGEQVATTDEGEEVGKVESAVVRTPIAGNLHLADVDGDGISEFVQVTRNKALVFSAEFNAAPKYHLYTTANILRLLPGKFDGSGRENLVALLDDGTIGIWDLQARRSLSPIDEFGFVPLARQSSFIGAHEDAVVGRFDGTGRDNILVYDRGTGAVRLFRFEAAAGRFAAVPNFVPGNLTGIGGGLKLYAGRFRDGTGRDDLAIVRPNGQVSRFDAVTHDGKVTFWWAFTTGAGQVATDEDVVVGNVAGPRSSLVLHSRTTGRNRLFDVQIVSNTNVTLRPVAGVDQGQIDTTTPNTQLVLAKMKHLPLEAGAARDDVLVVYPDGRFARVDSRASGSTLTYWWAFTRPLSTLGTGFPAPRKPRWLALRCKFKDVAAEPEAFSTFNLERYLGASGLGSGNLVDYFLDTTYGAVDLSQTVVDRSWRTLSITRAEAQKRYADAIAAKSHYRGGMIDECINAARAAGVNVDAYEYHTVFMNELIDVGASGRRVLVDPGLYDHAFMTHEMGHALGLPHAHGDATSRPYCSGSPGDGEYCDAFDTMGDGYTYPFNTEYGRTAAGFNAIHRTKLAALPSSRVQTLVPESTRRLTTVTVAGLNRPEANAPLEVRVGIVGQPIATRYLSVELRQNASWDRSFPQDGVLVRELRDNGRGYLLTSLGGPLRVAGGGYSGTHGGRLISVAVRRIDRAAGTATLDITY